WSSPSCAGWSKAPGPGRCSGGERGHAQGRAVTEPRTRTRLKVLAALVAFMFGALTTRLWFLQVLAAPQFSQEATANQVRLVPIDPTRGEIRDRNGNLLVGNARSLAIVVDRQTLGSQRSEVMAHLSALLNVPGPQLVARLDSPQYLPYEEVPVAFGVSNEIAYFVREHAADYPGVTVRELPVRTYPDGDLAAHVLGYLFRINADQLGQPAYANYQPDELIGQSGVEATYQQYL